MIESASQLNLGDTLYAWYWLGGEWILSEGKVMDLTYRKIRVDFKPSVASSDVFLPTMEVSFTPYRALLGRLRYLEERIGNGVPQSRIDALKQAAIDRGILRADDEHLEIVE